MKRNRPTWDEVVLMFENDKTAQEVFIEKHQSELKELLTDLKEDGEDIYSYFDTAFSWVYGIIVDWREYEEDLVSYFNEALGDNDSLSATYDEESNSEIIIYNEEKHIVPLTESQADRYIVIRALRDILKVKYVFKLFTFSYMSDTHGFLLLPSSWWEEAEGQYPEKVKELFMDITETLDFP
ncbi:MAG: hypothetical protein LBV71_10260 [Prevotella sp.]|jgi:hypothetical protein|nr:hypothetical protein [Prevotella sp.]